MGMVSPADGGTNGDQKDVRHRPKFWAYGLTTTERQETRKFVGGEWIFIDIGSK